MSAKDKGKKKQGGKKRIPGKVILPVAVFAAAAAISAIVVGFLVGGDKTTESAAAISGRPPAASLVMPPPLPEDEPETPTDTVRNDFTVPEQTEATVAARGSEPADKPGGEPAATPQPEPSRDPSPTLPSNAGSAEAPPAAESVPPQLANLTPSVLPDNVDPELVERTPQGFLPRVGPDGRQPWQVYARPFDATDERPRLAVVLTSLGLSSAATEAAIQGLPGGITLAFQPYGEDLQQWIGLARAAGHEVLLNLPMEPVDYPSSDPGPQALFTALTPQENLTRLDWVLSRVTGYVGVTNFMGSRFTTSRDAMLPVVQTLKDRGLLLLDSRASARSVAATLATELAVPRAINDRFLDTGEVTRVSIDARLAEAERIALEVGTSVVIGQPYPVTIERLRAWALDLESRGIALAPLSAVVDLQEDR